MTTNAWDNYIVNTGTADNARNGDALRRAFEKVNQKFYNKIHITFVLAFGVLEFQLLIQCSWDS